MSTPTPALRIDLRDETSDDRAFVDSLVRNHLREAMGGLDAGPLLDLQLSSRAAMLEQTYPDLHRRIALAEGECAGILLTGPRDGATHVVEIVIAPEWRRRGVAAAILTRVAADAGATGRDVTAHIFVSNAASLALFGSLGFTLTTDPGAAQSVARLRTDSVVTRPMA